MGCKSDILAGPLAQRIIDRVRGDLDVPISIAQPDAWIIASSCSESVNRHDPLAAQALARRSYAELAGRPFGGVGLPLRYDDTIVGAIVIHGAPERIRVAAHIAKTLAELIIHQGAVIEELGRQPELKNAFISDLLLGRSNGSPDLLPPEAAIYGLDLTLPRVVIAVDLGRLICKLTRPSQDRDTFPVIAHQRRIERAQASFVTTSVHTLGDAITEIHGFIDHRWMVFMPAIDPACPERCCQQFAARVEGFVGELGHANHVSISAGIGRYHGPWPNLCHSFLDAQAAAEIGERLYGAGRVYLFEQLGLLSYLADVHATTRPSLAMRVLQPLVDEPNLISTLAVFFRSNLSPSAAAGALQIHRHTLAYRLDKIERLTGLDPRRFEAATQLYAALLLAKTNGFLQTLLENWP